MLRGLIAATLVTLAGMTIQAAEAQQLPVFDRDDFEGIVLSRRQVGTPEVSIGGYKNESVAPYSARDPVRRIGRSVGRLTMRTDTDTVPCTAFLISP